MVIISCAKLMCVLIHTLLREEEEEEEEEYEEERCSQQCIYSVPS